LTYVTVADFWRLLSRSWSRRHTKVNYEYAMTLKRKGV